MQPAFEMKPSDWLQLTFFQPIDKLIPWTASSVLSKQYDLKKNEIDWSIFDLATRLRPDCKLWLNQLVQLLPSITTIHH